MKILQWIIAISILCVLVPKLEIKAKTYFNLPAKIEVFNLLMFTSSPAPAEKMKEYESLIKEAATEYNLEPSLIKAVIHQESYGRATAVSYRGAKGLMQLMDNTAEAMGVKNVYDPRENIMGGAKYLRSLLDRFDDDEKLALASYNAGPTIVDKYKAVPPIVETRSYVQKVLDLKKIYS